MTSGQYTGWQAEDMNIKGTYSGVIVPMITPVNGDLTIDQMAVHMILDTFVNAGVSPFILGTTGESASLPASLKSELVRVVADRVKGKTTIYAGISGNCLKETLEDAVRYQEMGVDVVVAHLPFYFTLTADQILDYFEKLASGVPCPLIIYNNPITVKQSVPLDIAEQLSYHQNIAGIKDSERGIERLDRSIQLWKNREDFVHLVGWTAQAAYALLKGSDGIVPSTANFIPELYQSLYTSAGKGDQTTAFDLQDRADRISDIYLKDRSVSQSIPALKYVMSLMGLCQSHVFPPLNEPDIKEQNKIRDQVKSAMGISLKS